MSVEENKKVIIDAMAEWQAGDGSAFFRRLADDAEWTVTGSTPVSATFRGKKEFVDGALKPLSGLLAGAIKPTLVNVLGEGDTVVLQWNGSATASNGMPYHNMYCWVMEIHGGKITKGTAYLDTELVSKLFDNAAQ
ncbi:MAG: nuclear transport factor 2 family protein [Gammaproteobacteria bacterium]|nr:nuclear transport factor 2 family protein [Gammaproteobacteria bacterium]